MKRLILLLFTTIITSISFGQKLYVEPKLNLASAAITISNIALEVGFGECSAFEFSNVASFAKENYMGTGMPLLINMSIVEYRRYVLNNEHKGLFVGADLGWDMFKINKNSIPLIAHDHSDSSYDVCVGGVIGFTFGYKFKLNHAWGIETSVSGGWHHAFHESYTAEGVRTVKMNETAEWLLYKGGVYLTYRFGN